MSEIWTATGEKDGMVQFTVKDEESGEEHQEERMPTAVRLILVLGGYPVGIGAVMDMRAYPWRFRRIGHETYLDDPSIGRDDYHSITGG